MLKLCLGRAGTGKTAAILRAMAESGGVRPQVLIVPEQHSHDMERKLCAVAGNCVSGYAEVLSFTRLASRVFSVTGGQAAPTLDAGGRLLLMHTALRSVSQALKVYARPSRRPEFLTGLIATVDELKSCCVSPERLAEAGEEALGSEGEKLLDLSLIYGAYETFTARQGADPRDRITRLAEGLKESRWTEGVDVYLDGFTDFTPQEQLVVARMMTQAHSLTVALTCDGVEETDGGVGIFSPARHTAHTLLRLARENAISWEIYVQNGAGRDRAPALAAVEEGLFAPKITPRSDCAGVTLFEANSPYSELEWTAGEILRLVREEGYRFRDIAVAGRSLEGYGPAMNLVFGRYGVPMFLSGMSDVLQRPVFSLVTSALATVAGDYRYDDLFRYLKTGLTDLADEERDLLENYALKWDLRGSRWKQKAPWAMHPRGYGLPFTDGDSALLARLDALRRRVVEPLEKLRKNPVATGRGQAIALYSFLEEIALPETLRRRTEELTARGEAALAQEYGQLWDILCNALEQCAQILGESPLELDEFHRLFTLVLSQYDVGTIPVSLDAVTVGEMPRLAHKECKALFLVGAEDTALPQASPSPGLLNDDDRSLLASLGLEMAPSLTDKLYREMTIVYETLSLPSHRLCVSWPLRGSDGGERRRAFLVHKLQALFPQLKVLREAALDDGFRLSAPRPALELAGRRAGVAEAMGALPEYTDRVARMEFARSLSRGSLTRPTVEALYGRRVPMSASRMDKYKSCHFSYFMQYGLRAEPRKAAGFQAPEYGTFVHYVLEHVLREPTADRKALHALTGRIVEQYVKEELGGLENETPRFQYLFKRLLKSVYAVVDNVAEELARSQFKPLAFELGFGRNQDLPPVEFSQNGVTVSVSGFVDRVDGWEKDGRLYLRVVDYKTGRKSFDLTDVWNGLGLQMLLYLFTLEREGRGLFGGKEIVPAGVLYLPARDAVVAGSRTMTEEERQKAVDRELKRRGLVLDDPEVLSAMETYGEEGVRFLPVKVSAKTGAITGEALISAERLGKLEQHIHKVLHDIGTELAAGNIAADPFWRGPEQNACRYCDYADACHFEPGKGGDVRRWLPKVKAEEFWEKLETEEREEKSP